MTISEKYHSLTHPKQILVWFLVFLLCAGAGVYAFGWVKDKIQENRYEKTKAADEKKAKDAEALAQQALGVAKQKEAESQHYQEEAKKAHEQLLEALSVLDDATKTTAQKRQVYERLRDAPIVPVARPGASADDLCATAKQLGIESSACR